MCSDNGQESVVVGKVREQHHCCKKWEGFEKVRRGLIYAIGQTAKWWNVLFAAAGRPTITALPTD